MTEIGRLGYTSERCVQDFQFSDWFSREQTSRTAAAAVFGRVPHTYDSACFAVLRAGSKVGQSLVYDYRAIGAPLAFEVESEAVNVWRVGTSISKISLLTTFTRRDIKRIRQYESQWSPESILRAKNIGVQQREVQTDFVDLDLIPALESEICSKLDNFFHEVLAAANSAYRKKHKEAPNVRELFRLVFRFLAAKILHDRGVHGFKTLTRDSPASEILERVNRHYRDAEAVLDDAAARKAVADVLWRQIDFRNLSVEILAYVYENTLITKEQRDTYGIHSTPHSIARYIVSRIPFENFAENERIIAEPCSGHGIFLVAALQRLRELSKIDDSLARHEYFTRMLHGIEQDSFAHEVSKISLMLADFPNPNGWNIINGDVFTSPEFSSILKSASVVLANPPFENFTPAERTKYGDVENVQKPIALLLRAISDVKVGGSIGFVLPQLFIDGRQYASVRKSLAEYFKQIEVVALPDRIFTHSSIESAIVIANGKRTEPGSSIKLKFSAVEDADRARFLRSHTVSSSAEDSVSVDDFSATGRLVPLHGLWKSLSGLPKLSEVADVHRGVEWQAPFDESKLISENRKDGFLPGFYKAQRAMRPYFPPRTFYLNTAEAHRRGKAFDLPWKKPKAVTNAVRSSRGHWRLIAFPDTEGRLATQNFVAFWPRGKWTAKVVSAVLNSGLANAFVAANCPGKHNKVYALNNVPVPMLSASEVATIDEAVSELIESDGDLHLSSMNEKCAKLITKINALVMAAYRLSFTQAKALRRFMGDAAEGDDQESAEEVYTAILDQLLLQGVLIQDIAPILAYFEKNSGIAPLIPPLVDKVKAKVQEASEVALDVFESRDSDESFIRVVVRCREYPEDFTRRLDRIWETEFKDRATQFGDGWISLTTDFASPSQHR